MKTHLAVSAVFPLFLCAAALAQSSLTPPPIRMGLWQHEVTTSGMPGANGPHTIVTQACVTPETWTRSFQNPRRGSEQCTTTNLHQSDHSVTFDVECSAQNVTTSTHVQMSLDSDSEMHGTVDTKVSGPGFPGMTVTGTLHSKFLATDCGDIKPGQSRMAPPQ